jgi:hypothetical protein
MRDPTKNLKHALEKVIELYPEYANEKTIDVFSEKIEGNIPYKGVTLAMYLRILSNAYRNNQEKLTEGYIKDAVGNKNRKKQCILILKQEQELKKKVAEISHNIINKSRISSFEKVVELYPKYFDEKNMRDFSKKIRGEIEYSAATLAQQLGILADAYKNNTGDLTEKSIQRIRCTHRNRKNQLISLLKHEPELMKTVAKIGCFFKNKKRFRGKEYLKEKYYGSGILLEKLAHFLEIMFGWKPTILNQAAHNPRARRA